MAVKFDDHIDIDAPPDVVWSLLSDPAKWPLWFKQFEQVSGLSKPSSGASFQWRHGGDNGTGVVLVYDPEKYILKLETREGNNQRTHTFDIDRSGGFLGMGANDARLRYTLEYDPPGGFLGDFVAGGNPADTMAVNNLLKQVRELAESMKSGR